ncbi:MAG: DUF4340 domain-containing protein [Chitinophagales bacterium]|nr:DUF4340 domain-containing protein [Bacteroidota bacterium]MCB9042939.1 DUF4340 domain-containing protein [Chitinophagales bacterium]
MKKYLLPLLIIALVGLSFYYWNTNRQNSTLSDKSAAIAFPQTDVIQKIVIADDDGKVVLTKEANGSWSVNNRYYVQQAVIDLTLETLRRMRIDYPVSKSAYDYVMELLTQRSKHIAIYTDNMQTPARSYLMGNATSTLNGTYLMIEGSNEPYVVTIPGMEGHIDIRFSSLINNWRDRSVFNIAPQNIRSIEMAYPSVPKEGFTLFQYGTDSISITPLDKTISTKPASELNKSRAKEFLQQFGNLNLEAYDNEVSFKDSILHAPYFCKITLTKTDNTQQIAQLYYKPINKRSKSQTDHQGNPLKHDIDRYYALINEGRDFVIIQDFTFRNVIIPYSGFFFDADKK